MNDNELKLQQMLDNYQSRVRLQQQEKQAKFLDNNNYLEKRLVFRFLLSMRLAITTFAAHSVHGRAEIHSVAGV